MYVLTTLTRMWLLVLFQNLPKSSKLPLVAGHLGPLVAGHLGEGLLELLVDRLELLLLGHQLVLKAVHLVTVYENYFLWIKATSHSCG